jgi:hypothetical protein
MRTPPAARVGQFCRWAAKAKTPSNEQSMKTMHETKITFGIRSSVPDRRFHLLVLVIADFAEAIRWRARKAAFVFGCLLAATAGGRAETLFGPGTINIATNEAIVITTPPVSDIDASIGFYLDGLAMEFDMGMNGWNPRYFIAGPHALTISNHYFITFQRLQDSSVKTVVCPNPSTNLIHVPVGKTIQFLARSRSQNNNGFRAMVVSTNSPEPYAMHYTSNPRGEYGGSSAPALSGPCDIYLVQDDFSSPLFVSYYFTDEVLQLPPAGFLPTPAPALEVNMEKSYDLTNWIPTATFNTEAEARAFYRLRLLK